MTLKVETVEFVGGPNDGSKAKASGMTFDEQDESKMAMLEFQGHRYQIVNYDKEKATLRVRY